MPPKKGSKSGLKTSTVVAAPPLPAMTAAARPAAASVNTIASSLKTLSLQQELPAARPQVGRIVKLSVNHYDVALPKSGTIFHYHVEIEAQRAVDDQQRVRPIPKKLKRAIIELFQSANRDCFTDPNRPAGRQRIYGVFDGEKNFYTVASLPNVGEGGRMSVVEVPENRDEGQRAKSFKVEMKLVSQLPIEALHRAVSNQQLVQSEFPVSTLAAFQAALREALCQWSPAPGSMRTFFFPTNAFGLGENIIWKRVWPGIFMSLRPNKWKYTLNLDVSHSVFSAEVKLIDFYDYFMLDRFKIDMYQPGAQARVEKWHKDAALKEIYDLKVRTTHSGVRDYRVSAFSTGRLADLTFLNADGKKQKVVDYFRQTYPALPLAKLDYPAVQSGKGEKAKLLPMELCTLKAGQKMGVKLSVDEQAAMVRACAKPAWERQAAVHAIRTSRVPVSGTPNGKLPFEAAENPYQREFGVQIAPKMKQVDGRILPMPAMKGENSSPFSLNGAYEDWKNPFKPLKRCMPKSWFVLNLSSDRRVNVRDFINEIVKTGQRFFATQSFPAPLNYAELTGPHASPTPIEKFAAKYRDLKQRNAACKPSLVMVIIQRKGGSEYAECKRFCDIEEGVVSQMIAGDTLARNMTKLVPYCSNVMLKINAKLNGTNQIVEIPKLPAALVNLPGLKKLLNTPIIIFGADVTHPAPGENGRPSIAAVTASMDDFFSRYIGRVDAQRGREEEIVNLKQMVQQLLIEYRRSNNNRIPQRLLFYRDGVSEGQYETVGMRELAAIQAACQAVDAKYKPGITYLIVGKRHHTRMFPEDERDAAGKAGNVPPGTVIDTEIRHYKGIDYFLCSHFGLQGTSRPAHYHVLADDNDLDIDSIELFSYYLCFVYQRCLRSVSLPAPTYYAHHVAFRARHHLSGPDMERLAGGDLRSMVSGASGGAAQAEIDRQWTESLKVHNKAIRLQDNVLNTQYFC